MASSVQLLPTGESISVDQLKFLMSQLEIERHALRPFDPSVLEFCDALARALRQSKGIRSRPALAALAWWLRPGSLRRLQDHWNNLSNATDTLRVPRGTVFHIPPTNVETILVYSWISSALAGNANVIRVSSSSSSENKLLFDILFETLSSFPIVAKTTLFLKYAHDDEVTQILSCSDVRVIWGGDGTVDAIKKVPSSPRSIDIPFSNRYSFSLLAADAINDSSEPELKELAHDFVNDAYWFDQIACSSPKVIFLLQEDDDSKPLERFINAVVAELARKDVEIAPAASMTKLVNSFALAADGYVSSIHRPNHQITVGEFRELVSFPREMPGGGLFYLMRIQNLEELLPFVSRTDQTMTHFGIQESSLRNFVDSLNGRGIDRVVPVGEALNFDVIWDGFDLLSSFSKLVHLKI